MEQTCWNNNRHGTTDWFQVGKGVHQGCILSPCLFNFYAENIMRNAGLEETYIMSLDIYWGRDVVLCHSW